MLTVLLGLGIALVVFGGLVLLRFSDRPGGTFRWLGIEVSSGGAGFPLIVLGVACIVFAIVAAPSRPAGGESRPHRVGSPAADRPPGGADSPPTASAAAGEVGSCLQAFVSPLPKDRVSTVEAGMRDVEVIGPHQPLTEPFAIVLTEEGVRIGAIRLRLYRAPDSGADLYRVEAVVDARCEPVEELRNVSRGGDPRALLNWDTLRMRLGEHQYQLRIGGEGDIGVGHFHRSS